METVIDSTELFLDIELFSSYAIVWFYKEGKLTWSFVARHGFDIEFLARANSGNIINL